MSRGIKILIALTFLFIAIFIISWYLIVNGEFLSLVFNFPRWLLFLPIIIMFLVPVFFMFKVIYKAEHKKNYDSMRKQHLEFIRKGFRKYYEKNGHYPMSNLGESYSNRWVRIPQDWIMFQFPSYEEMRNYVPEVSLHDPTTNIDKPEETTQYLYKVADDGKSYAIYAHLDSLTDKDLGDYNAEDGIDPSVGIYNYKIISG